MPARLVPQIGAGGPKVMLDVRPSHISNHKSNPAAPWFVRAFSFDGLVKSPISPPLSKIPHSSGGGRGLISPRLIKGRGCKYLKCCLIHPHLHPVKSPKGSRQRQHLTGHALCHQGRGGFRLFTKPSIFSCFFVTEGHEGLISKAPYAIPISLSLR